MADLCSTKTSFTEGNKLALLNTFFCTPRGGMSYAFPRAHRYNSQAHLDYIQTKQADRRLVRRVNIRSPPLGSLTSDTKLVFATVRIPGRSGPRRKRRESTMTTLRTADIQQLMADPEVQREMMSASSAALPPVPNRTCINETAADMAFH